MNLPPISDTDWPETVTDMRDGFAGQLNVYRVMAHHPDLLRAWADLRNHIVQRTALGPVRAEVVILRLAHRIGSAYEWNQHVVRALKVGLTPMRIATLRGDPADMSPDDATLVRAVDALHAQARLDADLQRDLLAVVGKAGMLDLMATLGMYFTLGCILRSFATPLDQDVSTALNALAPDLRMPTDKA